MGGPNAETFDPARLRYVRLKKEHLPLLLPLEHEAYPDPWTQGMFLQEITNATSNFFLVFHEDTLVAYGGFWLIFDEIHITKLTVAAPYRARRLGSALMEFLEAQGRDGGGSIIRLEVRESNTVARRLYQRLGFEEIGVRKDYYAIEREDAVVMAKILVPPEETGAAP